MNSKLIFIVLNVVLVIALVTTLGHRGKDINFTAKCNNMSKPVTDMTKSPAKFTGQWREIDTEIYTLLQCVDSNGVWYNYN